MTPYISFHPGGVKYIMMGAGRDATLLFNKYHAWVNIDFLMSKCLVGLVEAPSKGAAAAARADRATADSELAPGRAATQQMEEGGEQKMTVGSSAHENRPNDAGCTHDAKMLLVPAERS